MNGEYIMDRFDYEQLPLWENYFAYYMLRELDPEWKPFMDNLNRSLENGK